MKYDIITQCPCCGSRQENPAELYDICPECGWEFDPVQMRDPDYSGGANRLSLNEARREYEEKNKEKEYEEE